MPRRIAHGDDSRAKGHVALFTHCKKGRVWSVEVVFDRLPPYLVLVRWFDELDYNSTPITISSESMRMEMYNDLTISVVMPGNAPHEHITYQWIGLFELKGSHFILRWKEVEDGVATYDGYNWGPTFQTFSQMRASTYHATLDLRFDCFEFILFFCKVDFFEVCDRRAQWYSKVHFWITLFWMQSVKKWIWDELSCAFMWSATAPDLHYLALP